MLAEDLPYALKIRLAEAREGLAVLQLQVVVIQARSMQKSKLSVLS